MEARSRCLQPRCCKIIGLSIGWLGVLVSCVLIWSLYEHPGRFGKSIHESIVPFLPALNFVSSYSWLFGIDRKKTEFMLASLVWWATNLCLVVVCIYSSLSALNNSEPNIFQREMAFVIATVYWACSYVIAVICYISMREVENKTPVDV